MYNDPFLRALRAVHKRSNQARSTGMDTKHLDLIKTRSFQEAGQERNLVLAVQRGDSVAARELYRRFAARPGPAANGFSQGIPGPPNVPVSVLPRYLDLPNHPQRVPGPPPAARRRARAPGGNLGKPGRNRYPAPLRSPARATGARGHRPAGGDATAF